MNQSIFLMLIVPYSALGIVGYCIYRGVRKNEEYLRGLKPRPVGFKFHAVLAVNSAHLASLAAQDRDRWLPLFWAIDNFKNSQAQNAQQGDWRMALIPNDRLPAPEQAVRDFRTAMD